MDVSVPSCGRRCDDRRGRQHRGYRARKRTRIEAGPATSRRRWEALGVSAASQVGGRGPAAGVLWPPGSRPAGALDWKVPDVMLITGTLPDTSFTDGDLEFTCISRQD